MSRRDLAKIVMIIFGFYLIYTTVFSLLVHFPYFAGSKDFKPFFLFLQIIWAIIQLIGGIALIYYAGKIACLIFPESDASALKSLAQPLNKFELQEVLFISIGIFILTTRFPQTINTIIGLAAMSEPVHSYFFRELIGDIVAIGFGLYLVFGARGVIAFIYKFKHFGLPPKNLPAEKNDK